MKYVAAGMNPMDLKRGIDKGVIAGVESIKEHAKPCKDSKSIAQVGTISANSDDVIGKLNAEAWKKSVKKVLLPLKKVQV